MLTSDYDYHLPERLIAQFPPENRGDSRLLTLNRDSGSCEIRTFSDFVDYINPGDCLVINNTKVINSRFFGLKEHTGARIEIFLIKELDGNRSKWEALIKPGKRVRSGTKIELIPNDFFKDKDNNIDSFSNCVTVLEHNEDGGFTIEFDANNIEKIQEIYGHTPLPPYIKREDDAPDAERYQTVFAKASGAVAAPTAGLHFTDEIFQKIIDKNINIVEITLHVGIGTFRPVSVDDPTKHKMHSEEFILTPEAAETINDTHRNGNKVIAIGTTSVRVLETCANDYGIVTPQTGFTDIFLYPPIKPKVTDMLLTNFHLPKSTLLMLVSIFASRESVMNAYEVAKSEGFRFYSYGDCMLLY